MAGITAHVILLGVKKARFDLLMIKLTYGVIVMVFEEISDLYNRKRSKVISMKSVIL